MARPKQILALAVLVAATNFWSYARAESLVEYSIKNAQTWFCRPGKDPTRLIKIGNETFRVTLKYIYMLDPCSDALEHDALGLSGMPDFEGESEEVTLWRPSAAIQPTYLSKLATEYLAHARELDRLTDSNGLVPFPLPHDPPGTGRYIGLTLDGKQVLTVIICPKGAAWCSGKTNFRDDALTYGFNRTAIRDWRKLDERARTFVSSMAQDR